MEMTTAQASSRIRASISADDPKLRAFLEAAGLPAADVETGRQEYLLAEEGGELVGTVGLERVGQDALVRSLAVAPQRRRQGLAARLDEAAIDLARRRGVTALYLLTTTAEAYALRRGYEKIARSEVPAGILGLPQFKMLCPATAVCMRRRLPRVTAR
jgi:amino-acid N-acetyltransferase